MDPGVQSRSASTLRSFLTSLKARVQEQTPSDAPSSKHYFDSVNMYSNIQGDDTLEDLDDDEVPNQVGDDASQIDLSDSPGHISIDSQYPMRTRKSWYRRLGQFFIKQQDWFFLLVLGLCSAIVALAVEEIIRFLYLSA
jgi:hypothetical protein